MSAVALFHFLTLAFRNQWATCRHVALKGRGKLLAPKEFDPPTFLAAGFSLSDFSAFHYRDVSSFPSAISVPFPSRRAILAQNLWRSSSSRHPGDLPSCSSPFCWLLLLLPQTSLIAACLLSSDPLPQLQAWSRPCWVFPALLSSPPSGIFYASKCPEGALHIQRPFRPLSVFQVLLPHSPRCCLPGAFRPFGPGFRCWSRPRRVFRARPASFGCFFPPLLCSLHCWVFSGSGPALLSSCSSISKQRPGAS